MDSFSAEDEALSKRLVDARLNASILDEFPGPLPTSIEQAYSVQAATIAHWPDDVVGWKVARLPVDDRVRFARERLAGPVYRSTVSTVANGAETVASIYDGGFAAIEAEVILQLGQTISAATSHDAGADLGSLVAKAFCGAEIASSPMPFVVELGAMSIISDMGTNAGVIVGPEIEDFAALDDKALAVSVSIDGNEVGRADPGPVTGTPFDALRFLIDHCVANGIELAEGTLISTGMITGVHDVTVGSKSRVDFGTPGWFDVSFEPVRSRTA